jgi:hypothetical protein
VIRAAVLCLLTHGAQADVLFEDHSTALPDHAYTGDWEHFVGGGVAVLDCNDDGLPDIYAAGGSSPASLFVNATEPGGPMAFQPAPLEPLKGVTGAYPLDVDGDGLLDLAVLRVGENYLLKGAGDCRFTPANADWGFDGGDGWSTAFSATWIDDAPVLAVGNYVDRTHPEGPFGTCDTHRLHRWTGAGFEDTALAPGYCALSMLFARDASGTLRLRISNDRHYYVKGGSEQMYDLSEGRFLGPEDGWAQVSLWGMGIASRDVTGDGRAEVMLTSMGDQLMQMAQEDGTYMAAPYSLGTYAQRPHTGEEGRPSTGWHAEFGDVDNDGRADLFIAKGNVDQMPGLAIEDPNNLLRQRADGTFQEVSVAAGVASPARSRGAALADFDADGRLDLLVLNRRVRMELYRNISTETGAWLALDLRGKGANSRAVGALVEVTAGDRTQVQEITVGGGHAGGQAGPLHFGLGKADHADLSITWPDGTVSTHEAQANQRHRITR